MIKIDGNSFAVPVLKMSRKADVIDKFAERTESGGLEREIIGVYFNYSLEFGFPNSKPIEYQRLWDKLTEPEEFHEFTVFDEKGEYTFTGYVSGASDEIIRVETGNVTKVICSGLKCSLTARQPARSTL